MLALPFILLLALQTPAVKARLLSFATSQISELLKTRVEIKKIDALLLDRMTFSGVYIEDNHKDTLLYSEKLKIVLKPLDLLQNKLTIKRIELSKANIRFFIDSTGTINLDKIIKAVSKPTPDSLKTEPKIKLQLQNVEINQSRFRLIRQNAKKIPIGFNYNEIDVSDLFIDASDFNFIDTTSFKVHKLTGTDKSGFHLDQLECTLNILKTGLHFNNVHIRTNNSDLKAKKVWMNFTSYKDFSKKFIDLIKFSIDLKASKVSLSDIGYFAPTLWGFKEVVTLSGVVQGPISDLRGKNLQLEVSQSSRFSGNISMTGLPDIRETFIYAEVYNLNTNIADFNHLFEQSPKRPIKMPDILNQFSFIAYKGKFAGFISDFVTTGTFNTNFGSLKTDLMLKPQGKQVTSFLGKLSTHEFKLGKLIKNEDQIGNISFSASTTGSIQGKNNLNATIDGNIQSFNFRGYTYNNITVGGQYINKKFTGNIDVKDPNVSLDFDGFLNFSDSIPAYRFEANVAYAYLQKLNLIKKDTNLMVSGRLDVNITGKTIDDFHGRAKISNLFFSRGIAKENFNIPELVIESENEPSFRTIHVTSAIIDASMQGDFDFIKMKDMYHQLRNAWFPSLHAYTPALSGNEWFDFNLNLKNTDALTRFFIPQLQIAHNSVVSANYKSNKNSLTVLAGIETLKLGTILFENIDLNTNTSEKALSADINIKRTHLSKELIINNTRLSNVISLDTIYSKGFWMEEDTGGYKTNLNIKTFWVRNSDSSYRWDISINPSDIVFQNQQWKLEPSQISISKGVTRIYDLSLKTSDQQLTLNGVISDQPQDTLYCRLNNLNLGLVNAFISYNKANLQGQISGYAAISSVKHKPVFVSDIIVNNLSLNDEKLGDAYVKSEWKTNTNVIDLHAYTKRGYLTPFEIKGEYYQQTDKLNFAVTMNKIQLSVIEPFLSTLVSDVTGLVSAEATLTGTRSKPILDGTFKVQKTSFTINYLKTNYSIAGDILVKNNLITLPATKMYDTQSNVCIAQGNVSHQYFRDFTFDILLKPTKFMGLNTSEQDNTLFYGKAFATGLVRISGPLNSLNMLIDVKSERNTSISIPINQATSNAGTVDFVAFKTRENTDTTSKVKVPLIAEKIKTGGLSLDMNFDITPDAEIQLIFDPKVGDKMRGRGYGNLRMEITPTTGFKMYGDYTISSGDYLFTLMNVINKKLNVESGSVLRWNGDPLDADVDIRTAYKLRASLSDVLMEPSPEFKKRVPVECILSMKGKLMKPTIGYEINLPSSDEDTRAKLQNILNNEEELNKQFITLLIINSFAPPMNAESAPTTSSGTVSAIPSEFLSNQLSNMLSQVSDRIDVGVNYRPGDEVTSNEIELGLSTQLLNDRITLSGTFGKSGSAIQQQQQSQNQVNDVVGDFLMDLRIDKKNKLHLKVFNRTNDQTTYDRAPYTQGIGVFYKEDFNNFKELFRKLPEKKQPVIPERDTNEEGILNKDQDSDSE